MQEAADTPRVGTGSTRQFVAVLGWGPPSCVVEPLTRLSGRAACVRERIQHRGQGAGRQEEVRAERVSRRRCTVLAIPSMRDVPASLAELQRRMAH